MNSNTSNHGYVVLRSNGCDNYRFDSTTSDPYESVRSYDHMLHKTLSKIFAERCLTSGQMQKFLRSKQHTDPDSIFKQILEREPALIDIFPKRNTMSILWVAVLSCCHNSAELLVHSGANVNEIYECQSFDNSRTYFNEKSSIIDALLRMYPSEWNERFIELVIDHGADLNSRDAHGCTVLHLAVELGRVQTTTLLLEKGVDVDTEDNYGRSILCTAAKATEADILLPLLVKHGLDATDKDLNRLIHQAASRNTNELVKFFLDQGADANARASDGSFPLSIAAANGNPSVLLTLLKRGANIDLRTNHGSTALHEACKSSKSRTCEDIKILLTNGADMFAEDWHGKTPFALMDHRNVENPRLRLMIKNLALTNVRQKSSLEFKDERIIMEYPTLWNYYQDCNAHISKMKFSRFIISCTFFELLAKSHCQIALLMRNPDFKTNFELYDLNGFSMYAEDIRLAFEHAQNHYHSMLRQEDVIDEALYDILPYTIVRKIARYTLNCEICEMEKIVQTSRVVPGSGNSSNSFSATDVWINAIHLPW